MRTSIRLMFFILLFAAANPVFAAGTQCGTNMTDNGDGTITDSSTGLTWKKCLEGFSGTNCGTAGVKTAFSWSEALNLTVAGSWRVPNIKELQSIVDETKVSPAVNTTCFPTPSGNVYVWSASPYAGDTTKSWLIDFNNGLFYILPQTGTVSVRLVKP